MAGFCISIERDRRAFLGWIADRFQARAALSRPQAVRYANASLLNYLSMEAIAFQADGYSWDEGGAHDIADEELEHWEAA